jgi:hypothetical protein
MPAANPKGAATSEQLAWQVAAKHEPKIRAAIEAALVDWQGRASASRIQVYVVSGDLAGLSAYLGAALGAAAGPIVKALDDAVNEAGRLAAADVNRYLSQFGQTIGTQIPFASDALAGVVFRNVIPEFAYNPVNPRTIAAVRQWQGNLIQQMGSNARAVIMDAVREGLLQGANPRTIARTIRRDLTLTQNQIGAVKNYAGELHGIVENGLRSAESWGIYTPRQIKSLKLSDISTYRRLNFTARELAEGRRWGKISRASGTLGFDPKAGVKPSKPIGFVAPPGTQGGENAFRLTADGKLVDRVTSWRLRDKRMDPKIFDVVRAREDLGDARRAHTAARGGSEIDAAAKAMDKAQAAHRAALDALSEVQGRMVENYRLRMLKHRSQVIARTESLRAANLGSFEAWRQTIDESDLFAPDEVKRIWTTARDDRVRMTHRFASGQKVGMHEPFRVDGEQVMFPPHSINCRCTCSYKIELT